MTRSFGWACLALLAAAATSHAEIFRWDDGTVIPGTVGIVPGPGVDLFLRRLDFADFSGTDLAGARFDRAILIRADLSGANLSNATFTIARLDEATFTDAVVTGASFLSTTATGFAKEQLYSTASYKAKNLQGIQLGSFSPNYGPNNLSRWNFREQDLTGASFNMAILDGANFTGANLTGASFQNAQLAGANLTGAILAGADVSAAQFESTTSLTKEQLYSTASYQSKNLQGIRLWNLNLDGWDLTHQDLTGANFDAAVVRGANLEGARIAGASFNDWNRTGDRISREQLYSTASYQTKQLERIKMEGNDLTGWDFSGQDLSSANLRRVQLMDANLSGANLTNASLWDASLANADLSGANLANAFLHNARLQGANLTGASVAGAVLSGVTSHGLTKEQFYATASYQANDLRGIVLASNPDIWYFGIPASRTDLTGWDFSNQDLTGAALTGATLANTNLTGAHVRGANLSATTAGGLTREQLYSTASYQARNLAGTRLASNDMRGWDFRSQNLVDASFEQSQVAGALLSGADTRGAIGLNINETWSAGAIAPDGVIAGLQLTTGEQLTVRNDHGVPATVVPPLLDRLFRPRRDPRAPIAIMIEDRMTMSSGAVLQLVFDAEPWNSLISFEPGIPVTMGGSLELAFAHGVDVAAQVGRTIKIFDWTGVAPAGTLDLRSPHAWDLSRLYSTGEVTLRAVPEPSAAALLTVVLAFLGLPARWLHRGRQQLTVTRPSRDASTGSPARLPDCWQCKHGQITPRRRSKARLST